MTVYLDVSAAVHRRAGLGRYSGSLARAVLPLLGEELALFYNAEHGIAPLAGLEHVPSSTVALGYKPWRMLVWQAHLARIGLDRLVPGAALFHATEHLLLPVRSAPTVLTVHDLIFRHYPQHHKALNRRYLNATMPLYCRKASHIIAVSEQTKRDVVEAYGIDPRKITVVYEAADERFRPQPADEVAGALQRYGLPGSGRYILSVGTIEPRKNLGRTLQAFEQLRHEGLADAWVIVGGKGWLYEDFFAQLDRSPARDHVIFPGYVPDEDLPLLYGGAAVLALPSEFEGFGLPVLEAMACGAPVVTSCVSSLPEVAGDAAILVDPTDVDAITAGLGTVLANPDVADALRVRGFARAARFSWGRAAAETIAVYRRAMQV
jgi:glycosyltransferase involved in cell wall biosynthesis